MALRGNISPLRLVSLVAGQLVGAVLGGALLLGVYSHGCLDAIHSVHGYKYQGLNSDGSILLLHTINAALLVLVQLWTHSRFSTPTTAIIIGFCYVVAVMSSDPASGMHLFNALRDFGVAAIGCGGWSGQWKAWVGSVLGALVASAVDAVFFTERLWERVPTSAHAAHAEKETDPSDSEATLQSVQA